MEMEQLKFYSVGYEDFKCHFEFVENGTMIAFGDYKVMKNIETGQQVLIKPQETQSLQETEELLATISEINIKLNSCSHFLQFLGFTEVSPEDREQELASTGRKNTTGETGLDQNLIYLVFEYFPTTIETVWTTLVRLGKEPIENILLRMAQQIAECFSTLEILGQAHTDVSLQNIMCYESQLDGLVHFKLLYSQYTTSAFRQVIDLQQSEENYFLAPEIQEKLKNVVRSSSGLDPQKIDVFAFGQMLLLLAAFKDPSISFSIKRNLQDQQMITHLMNIIKEQYSQQFYDLLIKMTDQENYKRPNFALVSSILSTIKISKEKERDESEEIVKKSGKSNLGKKIGDHNFTNIHSLVNLHLSNQIKQLEKIPLQNRAQEIRNDIFSQKKSEKLMQNGRHDRSQSSYLPNQGSRPRGSGSSYCTPGRVNSNSKVVGIGGSSITPISSQRLSVSPLNNSPNRKKTENGLNSAYRYNGSSINHQQSQGSISRSQSRGFGFRSDHHSMSRSPSRYSVKAKGNNREIYNIEYLQILLEELERKIVINEKGEPFENMVRKEYQDGSIYIGEVTNNNEGQETRSGKGIYYYKNLDQNKMQSQLVPGLIFGEIYAGTWKNNHFDGEGVYLFCSGERYEGELRDGQKNGKGTYFYANGNSYEGEWENDLKNGYGVFYYNTIGEKYEGHFYNGQRQGLGTYVYSNRDTYIGQWESGEKSGQGEVHFADGSRFEGEWKNNTPNGFGVIEFSNGDLYEGNFQNGIKDGEGTYSHKNANSKYIGNFKSDEPSNYGTFYYANQDQYEGDIKQGQRHGRGSYSYKNGDKFDGEWKFDKKSGQGKFIFSDGSIYEGQWNQGQIKGQGIMKYGNGDYYRGEWLKDKKHGKGFYEWSSGNSYKGDWRNDKMTGKGSFVSSKGLTYFGTWNENKLVSKL